MLRTFLKRSASFFAIPSFALTICLAGTSIAGAVDLGPQGIGLCFGGAQSGALFVSLDGSGNVGVIAPTRDVTIKLDEDVNTLSKAVIKLTIELLDNTGTRIWRRSGFTVTSNDMVSGSPFADNVIPSTPLNILNLPPTRHLRYYPFGFVCEGYGIVESGGQRFLAVSSGVVGPDESGNNDGTILKVWIVDLANGDTVRLHKILPQGGKFALAFESGIADIDNDGDDELVVIRSGFLTPNGNQSRFRITVDSFNLLGGGLEQSFNTIVSDTFFNEN
jgi:hypothetical protein